MIIDLRLRICCFWFENGFVLEPGKTRGAIGFALIFLCFVSLYQDKEMKRKDNCFIGPFVNGDVCCSASRIWDLRLVVWMFGVWGYASRVCCLWCSAQVSDRAVG
jgi:hypothetical protein